MSTRTYQAEASPPRRPADPVRPENQGFLILTGIHGSLEISSSPQNLYDIERRVNQFLTGSEPHIRLWAVSNWKVAVIVQAVVLLPAALMLISVAPYLPRADSRARPPYEVATGIIAAAVDARPEPYRVLGNDKLKTALERSAPEL